MRKKLFCFGVFILSVCFTLGNLSEEGYHHFLYVSDQRIVALEILDEGEAILNYINLGSNFQLLESNNVLIIDSAGQSYRSHLFKRDETDAKGQMFQVTELIAPKDYMGYSVLGNFRFLSFVNSAYLRVGSKLLELEPQAPETFERFSNLIGRISLKTEHTTLSLYDAGFKHGLGRLLRIGSSEATPVASLLEKKEVVPPVVYKNPSPRLTPKFYHFPDPVVVAVRLQLTSLGGIKNPSIEEGLSSELDQIAIEVVENSWVFLPAVSQGKTTGSEIVVRVKFER